MTEKEKDLIHILAAEWLSLYHLWFKHDKLQDTKAETAAPVLDMVMNAGNVMVTENMWLGDSGASCHMTCSTAGMYDCEMINSSVKIGNGKLLKATKIEKKHLTVIQEDGNATDVVLLDCKYVPELWVNLFSITKALKNGWDLSNKGTNIILTKSNVDIMFDKVLKTEYGQVVGVEMVPQDETANILWEHEQEAGYSDLNKMHGQADESSIRETVAYYQLKLQ